MHGDGRPKGWRKPIGVLGGPALVTGATGFIGGHLAERLADEGIPVTGSGRRVDEARWLEDEGVRLRRADLLDRDAVRDLVPGHEVVFHAAGWLYGDPEQAGPVNVDGTADLVRICSEEGVRRVVHVSTLGAYRRPSSSGELPIDESHPLSPDEGGVYQRTKAEGELRARSVARDRGLELTVARPGMVFGPRGSTWTVGMCRAVCGGKRVMIGDGEGHFHGLYVEDLMDGLMECASSPEAAGEAYNFCQEPVSFRTFLSEYGELCGQEPKSLPTGVARLMVAANRLPGVDLPLDRTWLNLATNRLRFSTEKARRELGWTARVGYDQGMERTKAWLRDEGHV